MSCEQGLSCGGKSVSKKSIVCDDWIDVPLDMFTFSVMCAVCLLVHGNVTDKKYLCTRNLELLCHPLLLIKVVGYSLNLMQIDLTYYLKP
jgi:hypothetical protein